MNRDITKEDNMNKFILTTLIAVSTIIFFNTTHTARVPAATKETAIQLAEEKAIRLQIANIREWFTAMGAGGSSSSASHGEIVRYLKSLGTPVSKKILQEMEKNRKTR
jgi:hypothetical protein